MHPWRPPQIVDEWAKPHVLYIAERSVKHFVHEAAAVVLASYIWIRYDRGHFAHLAARSRIVTRFAHLEASGVCLVGAKEFSRFDCTL